MLLRDTAAHTAPTGEELLIEHAYTMQPVYNTLLLKNHDRKI